MKKSMEEGIIFQLQSLSVNDGEGIRTVIFLSGCPLRCKWCSNPESWEMSPTSVTDESHNILIKKMSINDVISRIERDEIFYRYSDGGVTFSGGEATVQEEFLRSISKEFYDMGISMWLETCGYFDFETCEDILSRLEHIFLDIKHMDSELHMKYTGVPNELILENAKKLYAMDIPITVRIPLIDKVNSDEENIKRTALFMHEHMPLSDIEILPYHNLGIVKYKAMGYGDRINRYETPSDKVIRQAYNIFKEYGVSKVEYR